MASASQPTHGTRSGTAFVVVAAAGLVALVAFMLVVSPSLRQDLLDDVGYVEGTDRDVIASERLASGEVLVVAAEKAGGRTCTVVEFDESEAGRACADAPNLTGEPGPFGELTVVPTPSGETWLLAGAVDEDVARVVVHLGDGSTIVPAVKGAATGFDAGLFAAALHADQDVSSVEVQPLRGDATATLSCTPALATIQALAEPSTCSIEESGFSPDR